MFKMSHFEFPKDINRSHEKGWWLSWEELDSHKELKNSSFKLLEKREWLAQLKNIDTEEMISFDELKDRCAGIFTSHVVIANGERNEVSRGFVVSKNWEAQASSICPEIAADAAYDKGPG